MSKFLLRHQQAYGLEIVDRDASTGAVSAVRCLFCARLGRDPMPEGAQRQRKRRVMVWRQFSTKNYRAHHEGQHAAHWKLYEECTPAEKDAFFDTHAGDDVMASPPPPQAKEKRPVGRPRKDASAPIKWSSEMTQRLVELRSDVFATWFADLTNKSDVHDGWEVIASTLADEYSVTLNVEQCRAKAPTQEPNGEQQAPTISNNTMSSSSNGEAAAPATTGQNATAPAAVPVTTALIVSPAPVVASVTAPAATTAAPVTAPTSAPVTAPVTAAAITEQSPLPQVSVKQAFSVAQGGAGPPAGAIDPASNKYFDPQHQQEYGVEIVERDPVTQAPVAVQCLFCVHMGRDPAPETSKRQRSQRVWVWKKFGAKNYRRHHERMHSELWPLYESSSAADKAAFFTVHKDYQPGTLPRVARPSAPAPVSIAAPGAVMMQNMLAGVGGSMMMPNGMPGVGGAMMVSGVPTVPMKRPRGRPRKNGIAAIQWTEAMVERLVMLRLGAFETWFADKQNHSALHDGWMLVASALASEFGVLVDSEQCKSKFRILRAQTQNRNGEQANAATVASDDGNPGSVAKRPRLSSNSDTMSLASATATMNLLLNSEQNADAQALLQRALVPAEARQQPQQQPVHVEEDANSSGSEDEESSSGAEDVNTLLLVRILHTLEEHKAAFDAQREAANAQTRSIRELLQFLRGRETEI